MIQYNEFELGAAPRTGIDWFMRACSSVGLSRNFTMERLNPDQTPWKIPKVRLSKISLTIVRDPAVWLESVYFGRFVTNLDPIGVPAFDALLTLLPTEDELKSEDATPYDIFTKGYVKFLENYLEKMPGQVGEVFKSWNTTTCIRLEDFPWSAIEFLSQVSAKEVPVLVKRMSKTNSERPVAPVLDPKYRRQIMRAEAEYCDRYEYF